MVEAEEVDVGGEEVEQERGEAGRLGGGFV